MLLTFLNILATIIGVISLFIVTYGVFVGFIAFLRNEFKRINGTYTINNVRQLRADFGSYLLLGLEFLIASDILKTVVDPTLDELAILGGVVVVRTVLSVFLNKEIKELKKDNKHLEELVNHFKDLFDRLINFIKHKILGKDREREDYWEFSKDLYEHGIFSEKTITDIKEDYNWSKEYDKNKDHDDFDLEI